MSMQQWTEVELFAAVAQQLAALSSLVGGKPWGADKGKPRVYLATGRKDVKVYFEFPDFPTGDERDLLGGAAFKVFIDDCGQHPNWYKSQREKLLRSHYRESLAIQAFADDQDLARAIMQREEPYTAAEVDDAGRHLANGRIAEARASLGL